jgi:hypothetical protein
MKLRNIILCILDRWKFKILITRHFPNTLQEYATSFKPAFCALGIGAHFTEVKGTGRETEYSPPLSASVKFGKDLSQFLHMY